MKQIPTNTMRSEGLRAGFDAGRRRSKTVKLRAATSTVTTKINEIRHGSSFSAESPTEVRFVKAEFGPKVGARGGTVGKPADGSKPVQLKH